MAGPPSSNDGRGPYRSCEPNAGQSVPVEPGIINTTQQSVALSDLTAGEHTIWVVAGNGAHVPLEPPRGGGGETNLAEAPYGSGVHTPRLPPTKRLQARRRCPCYDSGACRHAAW
ncbi:MAG TPA: hypothetical protein VK988_20760 [Acidimicrobiales bacterium]|nr:hypothetical protein [Acidimicrobiales bacterium]